ncbi:hypothetical protein [Virgibacillus salexigens]|uniref:hypothetical protein n=1 Tax=Virgibacillus salexigens TaxID=61016 RepID=UPI00190D6822|nr:hypothetical protein [Virgibacillus salexigens]
MIKEMKPKEQIMRINNLDSDIVSKTLLTSYELFWQLDDIIDRNVFSMKDSKISSKEIINRLYQLSLEEFGQKISDEYLNLGSLDYVSKELIQYIGFEYSDEVADTIITDYCMEVANDKDINELKRELIEHAIDLESID